MKTRRKLSDLNEIENEDNVYQREVQELLQRLSDEVFAEDNKKLALALALGRSEDEIERLLNGEALFDEDLIEKVNRLLNKRVFSNEN